MYAAALKSCLAADALGGMRSAPAAALLLRGLAGGPPAAAEGDAGAEQRHAERPAWLPAEQAAKALLAGNARGQLTTVSSAPSRAPEEPAVNSCIAQYLSPGGEAPVVLLSRRQHPQQLADLAANGQASLCVGATDPAGLAAALRAAGWLPQRLTVLGTLRALPAGDAAFHLRQAAAAWGPSTALGGALPSEAELLQEGGDLSAFQLVELSRAVLVDPSGRQLEVAPADLDGAILDPLGGWLHARPGGPGGLPRH